MISRVIKPTPRAIVWFKGYHSVAQHGRFVMHGLDPEAETPVYFLEPKRKLAATALLSGKSAPRGMIAVRLVPCGSAVMRLIDPHGKPVKRRSEAVRG